MLGYKDPFVEPIITYVKENVAVAVVAAIILIPLAVIYQKKSAPIIFHSIEYMLYIVLAHYIIYAVVQVIAWYNSQAPDLENLGALSYDSPNNPLTQNFFDKSLYNPGGLLYFEMIVALTLLYIVVVVRPTSYSVTNTYKGGKERGTDTDGKSPRTKGRYNRSKATTERNRKS